jgi:hypothetical protein
MRRASIFARLRPSRPSPAMVVAMIALVVACAGTATAATVLIHSSSQIANGVITANNIHASTITGRQIKNGSIGANQIANSSIAANKLSSSAIKTLSAGSSNPSNSSTTTNSAVGSALEWDRLNGPNNVAAAQPSQRLITASNVPAGVYAIFGETNVSDINAPGSLLQMLPTADAQCSITADADVAFGSTVIGGAYFAGSSNVNMMITHTFAGPGTITMDCSSSAAWQAAGSSIVAIRLSNAPKMAVTS